MSISNERSAGEHDGSRCNELLAAALNYAEWGWSVIPIAKNKKPPARFRLKRWQTQRPSKEQIVKWFGKYDVTGIAVICGGISGGLTCRDFDDESAYATWRAAHTELAHRLPTSKTSRGYHLFFRSAFDTIKKFGDGELRGNGYCVLPPSVHSNGHQYTWINEPSNGEVEFLDPIVAGFLHRDTEKTEATESTEENRETKAVRRAEQTSKAANKPLSLNAATEVQVNEAISATLPKEMGQRNGLVFEFARYLKAIPAFTDAAIGDLREIVRRWHAHALPVIGTKPFEDTWGDFTIAWRNIRFPKGDDPVLWVYERAERQVMPAGAEFYDDERTRRMLRFCAEFQRTVGDAVFFLSCRTAGRLFFDGDYKTAARRLNVFQDDRFLERTERGGEGRAARYRYIGPLGGA